ncbi:hypothetical protein Pcinc_000550 [Petrolisthes cinctipes]|uniref:Uncharacterized protein n=1 Tax=Petrolisthes cinctipes TaxID=88211 RepID=A0AAE1L577_PETCI|nr:hypothetical protein Pcinc_000550 [Petrolisthes cinctipes]
MMWLYWRLRELRVSDSSPCVQDGSLRGEITEGFCDDPVLSLDLVQSYPKLPSGSPPAPPLVLSLVIRIWRRLFNFSFEINRASPKLYIRLAVPDAGSLIQASGVVTLPEVWWCGEGVDSNG